MGERPVRSRGSRWPRRIFLGFVILVVLVIGFAAFLIGTRPGGRLALTLAGPFLPDGLELEVGEFSGRLFDRFELRGLDLRLPTIEFAADRVAIDWRAAGILRKHVHADVVTVEGLDVRLLEGATDSASLVDRSLPDSIPASPVGDLPIAISFDSLTATAVTVQIRDSIWVTDGWAVVSGTIDDYRLSFAGHADVPDLTSAEIEVSGAGSNTGLHLESLDAQTLGGTLWATGDLSWWPDITWDAALQADTLRPAQVLPDPEEWPGAVSLVGSAVGRISETGEIELDAVVDTLYGLVRGERIGGRFEAHLRGEHLELPAARVTWGSARVRASGTAGQTLDLDFEASAPDLGLLLPRSAGRIVTSGRATGPRDTPRILASFEAAGLALEGVRVETARGTVDLDLSGPVGATLLARDLSVDGRPIDSATVVLTGRRDAHRLEVLARGTGGELEGAASGGLNAANVWSGTVEALRFVADTVGTWALTDPVEVLASADAVKVGEACFESPPARVCAGGEMSDAVTSLTAAVDSFRMERLAPLLPDDLSAEAILQANLALELSSDGELTGTVELRTSEGSVTRSARGEDRELFFEPMELVASSGPDGLMGSIELRVTDSTGVRVLDIGGRLESPAAIRSVDDISRLRGQPVSAHLEVRADDLRLLTDDVIPLWDVTGSFRAVADLNIDAEGRLGGSLSAGTDAMILRNTVRGQGWTLVVDPARLEAQVGPDGLTGDLDLAVELPGEGDLLTARGQVRLPNLAMLDVIPEDQPVDGSLEVRLGDMGLVEAFLIEIADARGSFVLTTRVGGTLADLTVDGDATLSDGYALIPTLGLELTDIRFAASGRPDGAVAVDGQVRSGDGTLTLSGRSERYPSAESPSVFQVRGKRFLVMDIPEINLLADPSLDLAFDGSRILLTGGVAIPTARLGFPEIPATAVTPSDDVVIVGDSIVERKPPMPFGTDITVTLGDDVFFNGFGFTSNLVGAVRIRQEPSGEPSGRGEVSFINGTFRSFGQELRVEPGRLLFAGPIDNPTVDARAFVRASDGTEAGFRIGGTVQDLDVSTYSVPPKSDSDVMAYILFGRPMSQTSSTEGNQASNSAAVLGANMLAMSLAPSLGLDEARIDTGSSQNKAQLVVGKYLSPRLYLGYGVGIHEPISTLRIRYLLSARWSIEAITGDQQSTDLLWRIERGGAEPEEAGSAGEGADAEVE